MEAKDTVMSENLIASETGHSLLYLKLPINNKRREENRRVAQAQAEISFEAGEEYAMTKEGHEAISYLEGYQIGKKAGREQAFKEMLGLPEDMKAYKSENIVDEKSYKEGIKEVVGWIEENASINKNQLSKEFGIKIDPFYWQSRLQEWGIDG